ncbi:CaiB/BaiF CoA transferase family protein [Natrinema halophilum]|uniref:CaiB/BaiF CoA transferase family protein n=1 Tax=Natrinema halophilum TaxID=1699371 RepID=UPI001F47555D|nr:CoA transferase [Natrinema halophilum]UHQ96375.1 CoA transferase [Natrinema halophilum]
MVDNSEQTKKENGDAGPLAGLRVIDMTHVMAGPFATMTLSDLGADVIKIESPDGDLVRDNAPHLQPDEAYGGYFNSVNRNKRSVVLNLKTEEGKEVFKLLVEDADILIENFTVGTMDGLGLSYERLSEINPELIYASIRGFGDPRVTDTPYADQPAFDLIAQAMGGIMSITGTEETGPLKAGPGIGDIFPAVLTLVGILSALHHRERTGEGQYVDTAMVDGVLSLTERIVHQYSVGGDTPGPQGNSHPLLFPYDRFPTTDGYIVITAITNGQWRSLCEYMDRPDLAEQYPEKADRLENKDTLRPIISSWTEQFSKRELFEMLGDDVPCGPVYTVEDIVDDPHFKANNMLPEVEHADTGEEVMIAGSPINFSKTPSSVSRRAPFLGEHTEEVLAEMGFDENDITELQDSGAIDIRNDD